MTEGRRREHAERAARLADHELVERAMRAVRDELAVGAPLLPWSSVRPDVQGLVDMVARVVLARAEGLDPAELAAPREEPEAAPRLTPRQAQILSMLDAGMTASRVALELGLSEHTVRGHIKDLLKAFGVGSQLEALARARELGLLDGDEVR